MHPHIYDEHLECEFLMACISYQAVMDAALPHIREDLFFDSRTLCLAKIICKLRDGGSVVNVPTILAELALIQNPPQGIYDLVSMVGSGSDLGLKEMLRRLNVYRKCRALSDLGLLMMNRAQRYDEEVDHHIDEYLMKFDDLRLSSDKPVITLTESMDNNLQIISDNLDPDRLNLGLTTGFSRIDNCGGLPFGLIVIGAKPSHGKSALSLCMAVNASQRQHRVLYISFEMMNDELSARAIAMGAQLVTPNGLMRQRLTDEQIDAVRSRISSLNSEGVGERLLLVEDRASSIAKLELMIRQQVRQNSIDTVFIDYLQLMSFTHTRTETRESLIGQAAHRLHDLAMELHLHIVALSQVNRSVAGMPSMHNLRDSGQIAEAADCVIILYNAEVEHAESFPPPFLAMPVHGHLLLSIEKFRNGPTFPFLVGFDRKHTLIFDEGLIQPQMS